MNNIPSHRWSRGASGTYAMVLESGVVFATISREGSRWSLTRTSWSMTYPTLRAAKGAACGSLVTIYAA